MRHEKNLTNTVLKLLYSLDFLNTTLVTTSDAFISNLASNLMFQFCLNLNYTPTQK